MTFVKMQFGASQPLDVLVGASIVKIQTQLEQEKRRVNEEINNYPAPIPACDAQFNYLLEERARIFQELSRLDALLNESHA